MSDDTVNIESSVETQKIMSAIRTGIFLFIAISETFYAVDWFIKDLLISKDFSYFQIILISEITTVLLMTIVLIGLQKSIWRHVENKTITSFRIFIYCAVLLVLVFIYKKLYGEYYFYMFSDLNNQKIDSFYFDNCIYNPYFWMYNFFTHLKYVIFGLVFSINRTRRKI